MKFEVEINWEQMKKDIEKYIKDNLGTAPRALNDIETAHYIIYGNVYINEIPEDKF